MAKDKPKKDTKAKEEVRYTKEALVNSKSYRGCRDLLGVILADDVAYTKQEVDEAIKTFANAPVVNHINERVI